MSTGAGHVTPEVAERIARDLTDLTHAVEATLKDALCGLKGEQVRSFAVRERSRRRIGVLQEGINRRSLRLLTSRGDGPEQQRAAQCFNEAVLLAALANCAEALEGVPQARTTACPPLLAMADAALACADHLNAGKKAKIGALNAAIADARRAAPEAASAALVLEQVGELISGLQQGRRTAAA